MKKTPWKIYFWFLAIFSLPVYVWQGFSRFWEVIDIVVFLIAMIGLFAFCWKKNIFSQIFWKIFLAISIVWNIYQQYFLSFPQKISEIANDFPELSQAAVATANIVIFIPLFVALYLYAFKNDEVKKDIKK